MKAKKNKKTNQEREEKFPGYPQYDPGQDITKNSRRVPGNLGDEGLETGQTKNQQPARQQRPRRSMDDKNEFDVTNEDLEALGPKDLSMDMGDDEQLRRRRRPVDFAGSELDVPGSELDDADEATGNEDEENNSYSLGGDKDS